MNLMWLALITGVTPLAIALALSPPARPPRQPMTALLSSSLLCTLAFNLTFFWQELWLVLTKAMTPGLRPVLYHNDHNWTGTSPWVELLQGAGAIATGASGTAFLIVLTRLRENSSTWRLFVAWMAFEGLFQSLSQVAIGALLPGNDVGRALSFLGVHGLARVLVLGCAMLGMSASGVMLARYWPAIAAGYADRSDRGLILALSIPASLSVALLIPFRLPRELTEVVLVPLVVNLIGVGWTSLGGVWNRQLLPAVPIERPSLVGPASALLIVLGVFQLVLARGIPL